MSNFPWFRLYAADFLGDQKIKRIHKLTGLSIAEIRGAWLALLCLASNSPERGQLLFDGGVPFDYDDLVDECGLDSLKFHAVFSHLTNLRMVSFNEQYGIYFLPNWNKRQPVSDTTGAKRVREYRARQNKDTVTLQEYYSDALESESESESEEEEARAPRALTATSYDQESVDESTGRRILQKVAGLLTNNAIEKYHIVWQLVQTYGEEKTVEVLTLCRSKWIATPRKNGRGTYSPNNYGWVDWAVSYLADGYEPWSETQTKETGSAGETAWITVLQKLKTDGSYATLDFEDPKIMPTLKLIGGFRGLCMASDKDLSFKAKDFVSYYERIDA